VTKYLEEDFNGLTAATTTSNADGSKTVPYSAMTGTGKIGTWEATGKAFITDSSELCASATDKKLVLGPSSFMRVRGDIQTSHDDKTLIADVISFADTYMFVNSKRGTGRIDSRAVQVVHTSSTMGFVNGYASEGKYKGVWAIKSTVSPTITFSNKSDGTIAGGSLTSISADTTASTLTYDVNVAPKAQTKMVLRDNGDLLTVLAGADTVRHVGTLQDYNETQLTNSEPELGFEALQNTRMMVIDNVVVTACEVNDYSEGAISSVSITRLGSEIKMMASVSDTSFEKIIFAMAAYDEYGKLKDVAVETKPTQNGSAQAELTLDNFAIKDTIKAFVWNEDMKPISNPQGYDTEIKVSSLPGYGSDEIIELFEAPTICNFLNNKKAAVSMTLDDGYLDTTQYLGALFKENNIRGTVMFRADWVERWSDTTKAEWTQTLADGNMDVGNHSYSHSALYQDTVTEETLESEIGGAREILKTAFPNEKILTFGAPFNKTSAAMLEVVEKYHGACRMGNEKLMNANPTLEEMYAVTAYSASNEKTADDLKGYVDSAVKDGKWLVMYFHEINESEASNEEDPTQKNNIKPSACVPFIEYVGENEDVWAGSFEEVVQYNREKLATTVTINEINETSMKLSITDTLDNTLYDFPLTVKVNVPEQWSSVTVTQNGQSAEVATVTENEKTYAYINIIPDKGEVELSTLNSLYGKELDSADYIAPAVCDFKDDKAAAVSVTFDDGAYEPAVYYNSLFEKYNIHGTAMLISSRLSSSNVALWQELIDEDNIDIGNHSRYHSKDYIQDNATAQKLADDITGGYSDLKEMFPDEKLLVYASPWTWKSDASIAEIKKNHFAHRGSGNGFVSANPTDDELFAIPSHVIYSDDTVAELKGKVDTAVTNGSWYSMLLHGTNDVNPETAELTINKEVCDEVFEYIGTHKDVWAGSMTEVLQYIYEKKNCTSTVNWIRENAISLSLTDTLDNTHFDFPLTLKVNVPSGWTNVTVTQNSESVQVSAFEKDGKNYAYINVVPDNGEVVLENK
ncbi:MAG: polysaccharide deacetylase family protein, partial [Clostridia bacterium]|nr:polysaccharide deacetylase family protein [Clostridia bacterium]